ncbi:MAG: helix-turn-helix domain-containing protein [Mesorhizobium sp.]|nr:MAG: helix-turn-helix domain-containing protein [Mesorhizobium sp.]
MSTKTPPTAEIIELPLSTKDKRHAEAKYGKAVMAHGFTILPNLIFEAQAHLKISPTAFNVLLHLVMHWWEAHEAPHPSIKTIARRMAKSPRSLFRYFDELEAAGLVQRVARYRGEKAQTSSAYVLTGLVDKLKSVEPEIAKAKKFKAKRLEKAEEAPSSAA